MRSVTSAQDLQTPKSATVEGFSWQAEQKIGRAKAFTQTAEYFRKKARSIQSHSQLNSDSKLYEFSVAACSLSRKSLNHLSYNDIQDIFVNLIDITRLSEDDYLLELEARYFLTCGDSLGGMMRNVVGQAAQEKFTDGTLSSLTQKNINPQTMKNAKGKITSIHWPGRALIFDKKPRFINKSIDFILLSDASTIVAQSIENPQNYLAAGELKGGIDPAGADEHWKTARSALDRIRDAFTSKNLPPPTLFFVGAAIEAAMAVEIFTEMNAGTLTAANLTNDVQFCEVIDTIIGL